MNILLSADNNFVQHCCVTMTSLLLNNRDVTFYVFTEDISEENELLLRNQVERLGGKLILCIMDSDIVAKFPMPSTTEDHITVATYYRLFAEMVLPKDIDKVIYMDCDIVVRSSIENFWNEDIENYALGAVYQKQNTSQINDMNRLRIPIEYGYFNAGVLLMNLKYWRENHITEKLFDFISNNYHLVKQHDQDVLNAVLYNQTRAVSYVWNYLPLFKPDPSNIFPKHVDYSIEYEPVIIHFVSIPKPWEIGSYNPYTYEYYKYLDETPYKGWKPKLVLKKYWNHVIKVKIIRIIVKVDFLNLRKIIH